MKMYVCILFCSAAVFLAGESKFSPEYELLISEANNYYDSGNYEEAVVLFQKAASLFPSASDAYLQIGNVHLTQKLYSIALNFFLKALEAKDGFILAESRIELLVNMAITYHHLSLYNDEIAYLQKIINSLSGYENSFNTEIAGWTHFALGLNYLKQKEYAHSIDNFLKSIQFNYWNKSCYMYIAHFYFSHNRDEIDLIHQKRSEKIKTKSPDVKERYFNYYFTKFEQTTEKDSNEKLFLKDSKRAGLINEMRVYKSGLTNGN